MNQKHSRPQYGLQEELMVTIYKLIDKKTSRIFREPVDIGVAPDYYDKIKQPIDLSTITKNIKSGTYRFAKEVLADLQLMIQNCRSYNIQPDILKPMQKFQKSIQTQWGNFQRELIRKQIDIDAPLEINEELLVRLTAIEDKTINRKTSNLQINLIQTERRPVSEFRILPPLPPELLATEENQTELPAIYQYNFIKYNGLKQSEKQDILTVKMSHKNILEAFERTSQRKLTKYRKILNILVKWIDQKIIKRCLQRKRFKKMLTLAHLCAQVQTGEMTSGLQLRKLQLYVKQVASWVEQYPQILSYAMKNKFLEVCKTIKRCISRVIRYKRAEQGQDRAFDKVDEAEQGEQQASKSENKMKEFKRMLSRDQGETIKKYTKIMIKNENGQFSVYDWNNDNFEKKPKNRNLNITRVSENTEQAQRLQKEKQRRQERQRDQAFLQDYRNKSNVEIILHYHSKLNIDWDSIILAKRAKAGA